MLKYLPFIFLIGCQEPEIETVYSTDTLYVEVDTSYYSTPAMVTGAGWGIDESGGQEGIWVVCKLHNIFDETLINPTVIASLYEDMDNSELISTDSAYFYEDFASIDDSSYWVKYMMPDSTAWSYIFFIDPYSSTGQFYYSVYVRWQ